MGPEQLSLQAGRELKAFAGQGMTVTLVFQKLLQNLLSKIPFQLVVVHEYFPSNK